ncbi:hypothetical protein K8R43_00475 [archaeon]|nr:hypothetical protein [archaeon]
MKASFLVLLLFLNTVVAAPMFIEPTPNNELLNQSGAYINVTVTPFPDRLFLEWNGINETMTGRYKNKTNLAGNYSFKVYALDASNNSEATERRWVYLNMPPKIVENASFDVGGFTGKEFNWNYGLSFLFGFNKTDGYIEASENSSYSIQETDDRIECNGLDCTFNFPQTGEYPIDFSIVNPYGKTSNVSITVKILNKQAFEEYPKATDLVLRDSEGYTDTEKTFAAMELVGSNALFLRSGYDQQWNDLLQILPKADQNGIMVFFFLPDARNRGAGPCGFCEHYTCVLPLPYCRNYADWTKALANLSLEHPSLKGVFIDDFECGATCGENPGFSLDYIQYINQEKNRVNPNFQFLPGIYIPRGLSEFRITQDLDNRCTHETSANFTAQIDYSGNVDNAYFELITSGHESTCYAQKVFVNDENKFESFLEGPSIEEIDLTGYDLSNTNITYMFHMPGYSCYLTWFVLPKLFVNSQEVDLEWSITKDDCYIITDYFEWMGGYYDRTDGAIFWNNQFDLVNPENEVLEKILETAKERVGQDKTVIGHFYGAEPWKEPIFPSEQYLDTLPPICIDHSDGVVPWNSMLLAYYLDYSSGIFDEPENNDPDFDHKFKYPRKIAYEAGFYHGIETNFILPETVSDANITFKIKDDFTSNTQYRRWMKEIVIKNDEFQQNFTCVSEFLDCLWMKENHTFWWDSIAGNEGIQEITIPYSTLSQHFTPNKQITLILRMRADEFRGGSSSPPELNVWVTEPIVSVNGEPLQTDWVFSSGNALESFWLLSSEKIKALYLGSEPPDIVCGNNICEQGENSNNCLADCPPTTVCGNDVCESGETEANCPADCPPSNGGDDGGDWIPPVEPVNISNSTNQSSTPPNATNDSAIPIEEPVCVDDGFCSEEEKKLDCVDCVYVPVCINDDMCIAEEELLGNCQDCQFSPLVFPTEFAPAFLWIRAGAGSILLLAALIMLIALLSLWMKKPSKPPETPLPATPLQPSQQPTHSHSQQSPPQQPSPRHPDVSDYPPNQQDPNQQ